MAVFDTGQFAALEGHQGLEVQAGGLAQALHQAQGHQQVAGSLWGRSPVAAEGVFQVAVHRYRQVGGQGPGGRGPDGHEHLLAVAGIRQPLDTGHAQRRHQGTRQGHHRKSHIDALGDVTIGIFQLGLRQGRAGTGTPVHRLEAPVDMARLGHAAKHADLGRLIGGIQGQIGLLPLGPDAPALETPLLLFHLLQRPIAGATPQLQGSQGAALLIGHGLQHLELDRQAVAVPSGPKLGPLALEQGMFIDDVLENLVEGVAHMQGPIGIGGPVVQGEHLTGIAAAQPFVEILTFGIFLGPQGLQFGFALPGIGPHRKGRLQQVQRVLVGSLAGGHGRLGAVAGIIQPRRLASPQGQGKRQLPQPPIRP